MQNNTQTKTKLIPKLRFKEFDDDWMKKKLRNVSDFLDSKRIPLSQTERKTKKGKYPYYGASGVIDFVDDYIFDGEYILLGEDGANILMRNSPLAFLATGKFWVNNHAHVILAKESNKFLAESLERIKYDKYNTGTAQPKLNAEVCKNILINIPSLKEQQKIATFLTAVDTKIQQLTKKKTLLEAYKKGIMQQLFSQQLRFKNDDGGSFPDWEEKKLGEIGKIITGKTPTTSKEELWNGDIQFITPTDIEENKKFQKETKRTIVRTKNINILPVNTIVYTCIASIGKMCITTKESITNQQINSIIPNKNYNFEYVYYYLLFLTPKIKSTQANTTLPIINKTDFSKFKIKIPSLKEQQKIATYLSAIDKKIKNVQTQIEKTQTFKKGLLQQMFV